MPDPKIDDRSDEMEHDLNKLEGHIADAEKKLEARKEDADILDDVAGDWDGEQDRGGGDDPKGAADDAAVDEDDDEDPDARVDEETANPT